jgi:predicted aldo/keto reductase-like oxidoreductase
MKKDSLIHQEIDRRKFLKIAAGLSAMAYLPSCGQSVKSDKWGTVLPTRKLGKTGLDVTMFALGGGPPGFNYGGEGAELIVEAAFKGGCRFFETARSYSRGDSERAYSRVLEPYRNEIVLSSKSRGLDADTVTREIDQSLDALKTSYLDLFLLHNVLDMDHINQKFNGGVWDAMVKAKQEGKVRHLGFSGHADYKMNNYMLDMDLPDLEVMLMPINLIDTVQDSFTLNTLPKAVSKNIGVFAMKPLGGGGMLGADITWGIGRGNQRPRVIPDLISMEEAQHFVYSMPLSAASFGCISVSQVEENIAYANSFRQLSEAKQKELIEKVTDIALTNLLEHYKGSP